MKNEESRLQKGLRSCKPDSVPDKSGKQKDEITLAAPPSAWRAMTRHRLGRTNLFGRSHASAS